MPQKTLTYEDAINAGGKPLTYEDAINQGGKPADIAELREAAKGVGGKGNYTLEMSPAQIAGNQFLNVLEGLGVDLQHPIVGTVRNFVRSGGNAVERIQNAPISGTAGVVKDIATVPANALGNILSSETTDEEKAQAAGQFLASTPVAAAELGMAEGAVKGAVSAIPSKARAGGKFQSVEKVAGKVPIKAAAADDVALRAQELSTHGATMPKFFRDYLKSRGSSPDMAYSEARDFAKNSGRLSATESMSSNPEMKMLTGKFYDALKTANRDAASSVGMEKIYDSAIKEFRQASTLSDAIEVAAKWAKIAAVTGVIGATGAKLYKGLMAP